MNNFSYLEKDNRSFEKGREYIGASDIPTLAGLNKRYGQTPLHFWEVFTGRKEGFKGNSRTYWGHMQEPNILKEYIRKNTSVNSQGWLISRLGGSHEFSGLYSFTEAQNPDYPYAVAHADLLDTTGEFTEFPLLIQAKNTGLFAAKRSEDQIKGYDKDDKSQNGVPLAVYLQEQWELFCYGIEASYVAVLIDGANWNLYGPITPHKRTIEKCLALAEKMWWHIQRDKPPKPETWPDVVSLFPEMEEGTATIIGGQDYEDMLKMREELKAVNRRIKKLESKKEDIQNAVGLLIGGSEILKNAAGDEFAKAFVRKGQYRADIGKLKKEFPEVFAELETAGIIRKDKDTRQLSISGTQSSRGCCKQCSSSEGEMVIKKEGRKIIYGPFCRSCWGRIKEQNNKGN